VGGGFGGLQAVLRLRHAPVEITLIDRRNFHLFQPLVYQVATGALSASEIASPLRGIFKRDENVRVVLGEVTGQEVAELVGRGLTNREVAHALFLSVSTVEANLRRIYQKVGVRSRTELSRRLSER